MPDKFANYEEESDDLEGQLSIDVFQDEHNIYIVAPVAGAKASDVDLSFTENTITIKGKRSFASAVDDDKYIIQEVYWGNFARTFTIPINVNPESSKATLKDGLLKIEIPKDDKAKTKFIKVNDK
jgi:HSP20 family protein